MPMVACQKSTRTRHDVVVVPYAFMGPIGVLLMAATCPTKGPSRLVAITSNATSLACVFAVGGLKAISRHASLLAKRESEVETTSEVA